MWEGLWPVGTELERAGLYVLKYTCSFIHLLTHLFKKYFLNASYIPWEGKGYDIKLKGLYHLGSKQLYSRLLPCPSTKSETRKKEAFLALLKKKGAPGVHWQKIDS